jgi:hypothetical protein
VTIQRGRFERARRFEGSLTGPPHPSGGRARFIAGQRPEERARAANPTGVPRLSQIANALAIPVGGRGFLEGRSSFLRYVSQLGEKQAEESSEKKGNQQ